MDVGQCGSGWELDAVKLLRPTSKSIERQHAADSASLVRLVLTKLLEQVAPLHIVFSPTTRVRVMIVVLVFCSIVKQQSCEHSTQS